MSATSAIATQSAFQTVSPTCLDAEQARFGAQLMAETLAIAHVDGSGAARAVQRFVERKSQ
jgi:hypothetical protein